MNYLFCLIPNQTIQSNGLNLEDLINGLTSTLTSFKILCEILKDIFTEIVIVEIGNNNRCQNASGSRVENVPTSGRPYTLAQK